MHDQPELGADPNQNNAFLFKARSHRIQTPGGSHIRRMNPRDSDVAGVASHPPHDPSRTSYGPPLPEGVLEDYGGIGASFAFVGAHLDRQFEFIQAEWMNDARFFGGGPERDPISGSADGAGSMDIPKRPLRKRLQGLPRFVVTRGGEYCFLPGLRALEWLGKLEG
jgi:deferrochelatase/peroxidase EfeB